MQFASSSFLTGSRLIVNLGIVCCKREFSKSTNRKGVISKRAKPLGESRANANLVRTMESSTYDSSELSKHNKYRALPQVIKLENKVDLFKDLQIDPIMLYKNAQVLSNFVSPTGGILPRRVTGLCAENQYKVSKAIKRARCFGFMPYLCRRVIVANEPEHDGTFDWNAKANMSNQTQIYTLYD